MPHARGPRDAREVQTAYRPASDQTNTTAGADDTTSKLVFADHRQLTSADFA